jgi:hypothetical protein
VTQHEIYTFPVGMRIYDEDGVLQDPLTSGGGGSTHVFNHVFNGTDFSVALPEPAADVVRRDVLVQLLDPTPDTVELSIGANDGGQPITNNFTPGRDDTVLFELFYVNTAIPQGLWHAVSSPAGGPLQWAGTTLEWTLWCFSGTAPGFVGVPFKAGSQVDVWDS